MRLLAHIASATLQGRAHEQEGWHFIHILDRLLFGDRRQSSGTAVPIICAMGGACGREMVNDELTGEEVPSYVAAVEDVRMDVPLATQKPRERIVRCVRVGDVSEAIQCLVCLEGFGQQSEEMQGPAVRLAPCRHVYHFECLARWLTLDHRCPACRRPGTDEEPKLTLKRTWQCGSLPCGDHTSVQDLFRRECTKRTFASLSSPVRRVRTDL